MKAEKGVNKSRPTKLPCATGRCLCGAVELEIDTPAVWSWHDHSSASRRAHGAVYATYVGVWRSKFRITKGVSKITRFDEKSTGNARSFCATCGTPVLYERARSPKMVNVPRAIVTGRTGREPRYHLAIEELQDWVYKGEALAPLKGYPGVMIERKRRNVLKTIGLWDDS